MWGEGGEEGGLPFSVLVLVDRGEVMLPVAIHPYSNSAVHQSSNEQQAQQQPSLTDAKNQSIDQSINNFNIQPTNQSRSIRVTLAVRSPGEAALDGT